MHGADMLFEVTGKKIFIKIKKYFFFRNYWSWGTQIFLLKIFTFFQNFEKKFFFPIFLTFSGQLPKSMFK